MSFLTETVSVEKDFLYFDVIFSLFHYKLLLGVTAAVVQSVKSVGPASGRLGVRIPAATVVITGTDSSTAKRLAIGVSVTGPRR